MLQSANHSNLCAPSRDSIREREGVLTSALETEEGRTAPRKQRLRRAAADEGVSERGEYW